MVTTGTPWPSGTKTEVLDLENENLSCSNPSPFPLNVWGAVGSHLSLSPMICGGYIGRDNLSDRCFKYRLFLIRSKHCFGFFALKSRVPQKAVLHTQHYSFNLTNFKKVPNCTIIRNYTFT